MVTFGLFSVLRQLQTWLHQHIFKVGWLTTKNFQTTTILYYTFFLPGVVLHELVYWLTAGFINVRAESAIRWPEPQEIGELKLNFVKVSPRAPAFRLAVIHTTPLIAGLGVVWYVANNVFQLGESLTLLNPITLQSLNAALRALIDTPDFWLWFYFAFTVGNTMIPDFSRLTGYRTIGIVLAVIAVVLTVLGLGNAVFLEFLVGPVATILNTLSGIFAAIIAMNAFMVGILSAVENTIEWITKDSADFRNGKMITMTREERLTRRMREIERERTARERRKAVTAIETGPPSIYKTPLYLPGSPGDVAVTSAQSIVEAKKAPDDRQRLLEQRRELRGGAGMIPGTLANDEGRRLPNTGDSPQLSSGDDESEEDATS